MSSQIGTARSLRVFVEAADIELDDDGGLLWTSLQMAFPGCCGMYYRDREADCRSVVKFDGKRFLPPGGAWNDRRYYVTLGQRCHALTQPFVGYENATRQFERSVNVVQKMLGSSLFEPPNQKRKAKAPPGTTAEPKFTVRTADSLQEVQEEEHPQSCGRKLSPIEQQFAELAKISTGKDVIIDQQREEIRRITDMLQNAEKEIAKYQDICGELEGRLNAMDEELTMLRRMSSEQSYLGDKVTELASKLLDKDTEIAKIQEELEVQNLRFQEELRGAREKSSSLALNCEALTEKCAELSDQLKLAIISRDLLTNELASLRPLANAIDINNADGVMAYLNAKDNARRYQAEASRAKAVAQEVQCRFDELSELQTTVIQENTRLLERNSELEQHASNFEGELQKLDERWKIRLQKEKHGWDEARKEVETECASMKKQLMDLQDVLAAVTRDATESSRRAAELQKSRDELKQSLEAAEFKTQLRTENRPSALQF